MTLRERLFRLRIKFTRRKYKFMEDNELFRRHLSSNIIKRTNVKNTNDMLLEFEDGTLLSAWNRNKYYSWLNSGVIQTPSGMIFEWKDGMLPLKYWYKLHRAMKDIERTLVNPFMDNDEPNLYRLITCFRFCHYVDFGMLFYADLDENN